MIFKTIQGDETKFFILLLMTSYFAIMFFEYDYKITKIFSVNWNKNF